MAAGQGHGVARFKDGGGVGGGGGLETCNMHGAGLGDQEQGGPKFRSQCTTTCSP